MFAKWKAARKEKQRIAAEAKNEAIKLMEAKAIVELDNCTEKMLAKPCPFAQGNCNMQCVHFQKGVIRKHLWLDGELSIWPEYPTCKLWKQ